MSTYRLKPEKTPFHFWEALGNSISLIFRRCSGGKPNAYTGSVECEARMTHSSYSQNPEMEQVDSVLEGRTPTYFASLGK